MIIGLTGNIGSGKSTVAKLFVRHGYKHVNADLVGHKLLGKKSIKEKIVKEFGKGILTRGKIDRRKLKCIVFYDSKKLKKLNSLLHPPIIKEINSIITKNKKKKIVVEGALLIEAKSLNLFDELIVVKTNRKEQVKRLLKKKKYTQKEINNIIRSQIPQSKKLKYADRVIDNSKGLKNTEKQVKEII